jgi:hypothetical protein
MKEMLEWVTKHTYFSSSPSLSLSLLIEIISSFALDRRFRFDVVLFVVDGSREALPLLLLTLLDDDFVLPSLLLLLLLLLDDANTVARVDSSGTTFGVAINDDDR